MFIEYILIAAAKLANATQRINNNKNTNQIPSTDVTINNNIKHKHKHHHHHHKKQPCQSPILHPTGASLKSSASNGSGIENFSTDDAEESLNSKTPLPPNNDHSGNKN